VIVVRFYNRIIFWALVAGTLATIAGTATAHAEEALSPWWSVTTGEEPTSLHAGVAKNEVQQLTVKATGGNVVVVEPLSLEGEEVKFTTFPYNASAGTVQAALEGIYGAGNVAVTGGGAEPYTVVFKGGLARRPLKPMNSNFSVPLGGLVGSAETTELTRGEPDGKIFVSAQNLGDAGANGEVRIVDELPAGLEAVGIAGSAGGGGPTDRGPVSCNLKTLTCTFAGSLPAYEQISVRISVVVRPGAQSGEQNVASVSGGGAVGTKTASHSIEMNGRTKFGIEDYQLIPENVGGLIDTQAGSHPFQLTSVIDLNSQTPDEYTGTPRTVALPKDIVSELPVGLFGNPTPFAQCTDAQLAEQGPYAFGYINTNKCPSQTAIGVASVSISVPVLGRDTFVTSTVPIFNMRPLTGEPARFAFKVAGVVPVFLDASVRTGKDYGITISSDNIIQEAWLLSVKLTFWGVPGDPRHDGQRGWECLIGFGTCPTSTGTTPPPFLVLPTSCEQPYESTLYGDSWGASGHRRETAEPVKYRLPEALDGCNHLPFTPSMAVTPDVPDGSTSTGLTVGVHVPQEAALNPTGLAESTLRDTTVILPQGVGLNPAGADGLQACSEGQIGFTGFAPESEVGQFTPTLAEPFCPDASKIGTAKIKTPLLPNALEGAVYLAAQNQNPFGSLVAMYIVAQDPVSGTLLKLPGEVKLDPVTGQIVTTFKNTPELPFEDLELHFFGGARAPLSTPPLCGAYTTSASFVPWSGNEPATPSSTFDITSGPNGDPCHNPLPFSPSLTAGTTSIQAGGFSPFTMTMSRPDGSQNLQAVKLRMPPGLLGTLASVKLCPEAQANAGTCGPESLIGHTTVSVGVGGNPYSVTGGEVFITGPYKGAPYGLSIVNPAKAGPFDLGKVVVRAKIEVDPISAVLTVTTDDSGPYKIPTILDGIPLQIQHVNVTIDRQGFTFNPTNCSPLAITGSLTSDQGATKDLSVPFQITNCAVLAFKPKLTAKTNGKTSRANGASLSVKLTYPAGPYDANIARVKVDLPKQLPSRLTTLQKACPAATFDANPANCPSASIVGHATATTPVMPVPLTGPAYFVSHGGEAFPDLIIVLQGYGATVHLIGTTFISKAGITSSTFKTIPDVPVGTFEMTLPQGKDSALAANGNLCTTRKLAMPTSFLAQNGAVIHTTTPIMPTGCTKKKAGHKHKSKK
jgi:hypothetical protein